MSALDNLTVCVTSFQRPERLARALASLEKAGIRRVTICSPDPRGGVLDVIKKYNHGGWLSYDWSCPDKDIGCNNTWMVAAYLARTKRIIVLHDDDVLLPEFGKAYEEIISLALDSRDAGFASWRPQLRGDDGVIRPCDYFSGPTRAMPSHHLLQVVDQPGRLSLSPIVSVFNRQILIQACKEAESCLRRNDCLENPGMLLGTEILVYMRHIQAFRRWLYVDRVLSEYGGGYDSGTVKHQLAHTEAQLVRGYDLARAQGRCPPPEPKPKIILVYSAYEPTDHATLLREEIAQATWDWHCSNADFIELPLKQTMGVHLLHELLDHAARFVLHEDIILYSNADAGFTTAAAERLVAGIERGRGITCCFNRTLKPEVGRLYKSVANCKAALGIEAVAMTAAWWKLHRDKMPSMYIGREAWDLCFATLAEEWADGRPIDDSKNILDERLNSKAHTDDVIWHQDHFSLWQERRTSDERNLHNREKAREFFREHGCIKHLDAVK